MHLNTKPSPAPYLYAFRKRLHESTDAQLARLRRIYLGDRTTRLEIEAEQEHRRRFGAKK